MFAPNSDNQVAARIYQTKLTGLLFIEHVPAYDDRGFFVQLTTLTDLATVLGSPFVPVQINQAHSETNVARGFHAEGWNKLITVMSGEAFCALADVRPDSPTFGQVESFLLGHGKNALIGSLYIPDGIANSVCVVTGPVEYLYLVDRLYAERDPAGDVAISMFDPDLNVEWPVAREAMIMSQRDKESVSLRDRFPEKFK